MRYGFVGVGVDYRLKIDIFFCKTNSATSAVAELAEDRKGDKGRGEEEGLRFPLPNNLVQDDVM